MVLRGGTWTANTIVKMVLRLSVQTALCGGGWTAYVTVKTGLLLNGQTVLKAWYLHGTFYTEADYKIAIENLNKEKTSR
jgi:hypothetical protein